MSNHGDAVAERAKIVAWLREQAIAAYADGARMDAGQAQRIANAIERGEHNQSQPKGYLS
jgi:hypothetical protein